MKVEMVISHDYEIPVSGDRIVRGTVHEPTDIPGPLPVVLFCHGFKGFKDWGCWPWFCEGLASRGFLVHRINFSMSGVGPSLLEHDEPDNFSRNTLAHDIEDIKAVLEGPENWGVKPARVRSELALIGHSRGGIVASLVASEEPAVRTVVTLASPSGLFRFSEQEIARWRSSGSLEVVNSRTGQVLNIDVEVLDDYLANAERYSLETALALRSFPMLIIHGEADEAVSVDDADRLRQWCQNTRCSRVTIPDAGHTFGGAHPFEAPHPHLERVQQLTGDWLAEELTP